MGMIVQSSSSGVQDAEEAWEIGPDMLLIEGEFLMASEEALNRAEEARRWFCRMK